MKKITLFLSLMVLALTAQFSLAGMDGTYKSEANCTLTVEALDDDAGYADQKYAIRSDGTGACEWTGIGLGKRFKIEAGVVSQATTGFAEMNWVYGPEGSKVEITFFDTDGSVRHKEAFERNNNDVANTGG